MKSSAEWVERHGRYEYPGRRLADTDFERCVSTICTLGAPYNLSRNCTGWLISPWHVEVRIGRNNGFATLSTFDTDNLTRLVLAAHEHRVRVELSSRPGGVGGAALRVAAWPRTEDGSFMERHPGLADLASHIHDVDGGPTVG